MNANLQAGNNLTFFNPIINIDIEYFLNTKIFDNRHSDVVIEMIALSEKNVPECVFCTLCKIYPDSNSYKIKPEMQKFKVNNTWFDIQDVFGFTSDNTECEICCSTKKNTIFLPCKHSYACKECAIMIRIKGNHCPICRNSIYNIILDITDSIVIENIENEAAASTSQGGQVQQKN